MFKFVNETLMVYIFNLGQISGHNSSYRTRNVSRTLSIRCTVYSVPTVSHSGVNQVQGRTENRVGTGGFYEVTSEIPFNICTTQGLRVIYSLV